MAEGAQLTDDLRIDTRLANRQIIPSAPAMESPTAEGVRGLETGLNALDRNTAWNDQQSAKSQAQNENLAKSAGANAAITADQNLGSSGFSQVFSGSDPTDQPHAVIDLTQGKAIYNAVLQGHAPRAALEAAAQNAALELQQRYGGTPYMASAINQFNETFKGTSAGMALTSAIDTQKAYDDKTADIKASEDMEADRAARAHGVPEDAPDFRAQGYRYVASQDALTNEAKVQEQVQRDLTANKTTQDIADHDLAQSNTRIMSTIIGSADEATTKNFTAVKSLLQGLAPADRTAWMATNLPNIMIGLSTTADAARMHAIKNGVPSELAQSQTDTWLKTQKDAWTELATGDVDLNMKIVDLAIKNSGLNVTQVAPVASLIKQVYGSNAAWQAANGQGVLGKDVTELLTKEFSTAVSELQAGDRTGALATIMITRQLQDGTLTPADIPTDQFKRQNQVAQENLVAEARNVRAGTVDPTVFLHHAAVASYAATTTVAPGVKLSTLNSASTSIFSGWNVAALLQLGSDPKVSPDVKQKAVGEIQATRAAAQRVYQAALINTGQNDDIRDNPTGAWKHVLSRDGLSYQAVFDKAAFKSFEAAHPEMMSRSPASNPMQARMFMYGRNYQSMGVIDMADEMRSVPASVRLQVDTLNRSLAVLENPGMARLDPADGGSYTPAQLADHYIRGKPLPGSQAESQASSSAVATARLQKESERLKSENFTKDFEDVQTPLDTAASAAVAQSSGERSLGPVVDTAANKYHVSPGAMRILAGHESGWQPDASSYVSYLAMKAKGDPRASSFANSHAGGIFQFEPGTAAHYGLHTLPLKPDGHMQEGDDRADPVKVSEAAAHYLSDLMVKHGGSFDAAIKEYGGFGRPGGMTTVEYHDIMKAYHDEQYQAERDNLVPPPPA